MTDSDPRYHENKVEWQKGDIVIHRADAKEPAMLMLVVGRSRDGAIKTQYVDRINKTRKVWHNDKENLLDPNLFKIRPDWGKRDQSMFHMTCDSFRHMRFWNFRNAPGLKVVITSADSNGEADFTTGEAYMCASGYSMVHLKSHGNFSLEFVERFYGIDDGSPVEGKYKYILASSGHEFDKIREHLGLSRREVGYIHHCNYKDTERSVRYHSPDDIYPTWAGKYFELHRRTASE